MKICKTKHETQQTLLAQRNAHVRKISLVPTMGALHPGHLSLIDIARQESDFVVATIFVNPLQFGPNEDFETYPRQHEEDLEMLREAGCDLVFTPKKDSLFPKNFSTHIRVNGLTENHCGIFRPDFFGGIATIVTKLLLIVRPELAIFGEKDFQQLTMIRRMVRDLDLDIEIIGGPTIRENDGLAMSSRNAYLSPSERAIAPTFHHALLNGAQKAGLGDISWDIIKQQVEDDILKAGFSSVDYIDLVNAEDLTLLDYAHVPARILSAARIGEVRLIDNVPVNPA